MPQTAAGRALSEWRSGLRGLAASSLWARWRETGPARSLVCALHRILAATPGNTLQDFDRFEEETLQQQAPGLLDKVDPLLAARNAKDDPPRQLLFAWALVLRALDEVLFEGAETVLGGAESWRVDEHRAYVVPLPHGDEARTGQTFSRRSLRHHRIIPAAVDDFDIVLHRHPDRTGSAGAHGRIFGAAFFPGFRLEYDRRGAAGFVVTSVDCDAGIESIVDRHCAAARTHGCDIVVWPELTMHPERVAQVQSQLAGCPLVTAPPPIVVAGSWHKPKGVRSANLSPVLDGRGEYLFDVGKSRRFTFRCLQLNTELTEDIDTHDKLHVLATDRELIAFAICKDFCDKSRKVVPALDVDLVLVPSMGRIETMTSHRDVAEDMKVAHGTRTVVVQQHYPCTDPKEPEGLVLKALKKPAAATADSMRADEDFITFQREA